MDNANILEKFIMLDHSDGREVVGFEGIPFSVKEEEGVVQSYTPTKDSREVQLMAGENCSILFFLGMTTEKPEASEWWGQGERYYSSSQRLFIGDRVGRINIIYDDDTMETIPLIFGVNIWNYELVETIKDNEKDLNTYGGPYPEPFESDESARRLRDECLVLMENDSEKCMKYIFGVRLRDKVLRGVSFYKEPYKEAGFCISAVTGLKTGVPLNPEWKMAEPDFFMRREYYTTMDRLARRLYQFRDDIPQVISNSVPEGYKGPKIEFEGNAAASIFANVYYHNMYDMAACKVDEDGMTHTSSEWAPSFGSYVGMGTFKKNAGSYYKHIWTRDIGRELIELARAGINERLIKAAKVLHKYLYDGSTRYDKPNWKRIANASELDENGFKFASGKENDGHGAAMLFIYNLYASGVVDNSWLNENRQAVHDAVEWIGWQINNPKESNFDRVLYSQSEASTQIYGGYDLFSNSVVYYALKGYEQLAGAMDDKTLAENCSSYASIIRQGIMERFTTIHPRYGRIFVDTIDDCWTWEYKRFALLFFMSDIYTYDSALFDEELYEIFKNTYLAQKEDYFSPASGRQMGYGQGYLTETAILLDEYKDMTACVEQAAMFCYHHIDYNYIVPEGVIMHPSGRFWFRNCDLGNAVQQGEIVKCARLLIGLDDLQPYEGLKIIPRLPDTWESISVEEYPVTVLKDDARAKVPISMKYERTDKGYKLQLNAKKPIKIKTARFGPFETNMQDIYAECLYSSRRVERAGKSFVYVDIDSDVKELDINVDI